MTFTINDLMIAVLPDHETVEGKNKGKEKGKDCGPCTKCTRCTQNTGGATQCTNDTLVPCNPCVDASEQRPGRAAWESEIAELDELRARVREAVAAAR